MIWKFPVFNIYFWNFVLKNPSILGLTISAAVHTISAAVHTIQKSLSGLPSAKMLVLLRTTLKIHSTLHKVSIKKAELNEMC